MKSNKFVWVLVMVLVFGTAAMTFEATDVNGQERPAVVPKATPPINGPDLSKYGIADYDAAESLEASVLESRKRVSRRYDNEGWVIHNPQDRFGKIGRHTESIPPPLIPTEESDLIAIGKVTGVTAHLSNDKSGVYSEFTVKISEVLKNGLSNELERGGSIMIDRAGGVVRYPSGNTLLYLDSVEGLPETGREYAFFLRADKKTDNFEIITLHELQDARTIPLDSGRKADDIKRMGKDDFIRAVREKLSRPGVDEESRKDPKSKANDFPLKITITDLVVLDNKKIVRVTGEIQNRERHLFLLDCKSVLAIIYQHFDPELMPDGKTYEVKGGTGTSFRFPIDCGEHQEFKLLSPGEIIKFDQTLNLIENPNRPFFSSGANFEFRLLYTGGDPSSKQKLKYWNGDLKSRSVFFALPDDK